MRKWVLLLGLAAALGCSKDDEKGDKKEKKFSPEGKPACCDLQLEVSTRGTTWTPRSGYMKKDPFGSAKSWWVTLTDQDLSRDQGCAAISNPGQRSVSWTMSLGETHIVLANGRTATLYDYADGQNLNLVVTQGYIDVRPTQNGRSQIQMDFIYDDKSWASGKSEITVCD